MDKLMNIFSNAWDSLFASFSLLWTKVAPVIPDILLALLVLAIGLTLANFISGRISIVVKAVKVGDLLDNIVFDPVSKLTGVKVNANNVITLSVKWFFIATVIIAALDLAKMSKVIDFFNQALGYLPNIIVAMLIVIVGSLVAGFASFLVSSITKKENLSKAAKTAVNAFALIAALGQLATPIVSSFNQFVGGLSLNSLQANALFIGVLVAVLLASKNGVTKLVDGLHIATKT